MLLSGVTIVFMAFELYLAWTYRKAYGPMLAARESQTVRRLAAEFDAGLAFARRVGNEQLDQWFEDCRWLTTVLRGESSAAASAVAEPIDGYADNPTAQFSTHLPRAVAAAIVGDPAALTRHTSAAMQSLGLVNDHFAGCHVRSACEQDRRAISHDGLFRRSH